MTHHHPMTVIGLEAGFLCDSSVISVTFLADAQTCLTPFRRMLYGMKINARAPSEQNGGSLVFI